MVHGRARSCFGAQYVNMESRFHLQPKRQHSHAVALRPGTNKAMTSVINWRVTVTQRALIDPSSASAAASAKQRLMFGSGISVLLKKPLRKKPCVSLVSRQQKL